MQNNENKIRFYVVPSDPSDTKLDYMLKRLGLLVQTCEWMTGREERFREAAFFERARAAELLFIGLDNVTEGSLIIITWGYLDCRYSYAVVENTQSVFVKQNEVKKWITLEQLVTTALEAYRQNPKLGKPEFFHIKYQDLVARVEPKLAQKGFTPYDEPSFLKP